MLTESSSKGFRKVQIGRYVGGQVADSSDFARRLGVSTR
jgi:hypothetical protein